MSKKIIIIQLNIIFIMLICFIPLSHEYFPSADYEEFDLNPGNVTTLDEFGTTVDVYEYNNIYFPNYTQQYKGSFFYTYSDNYDNPSDSGYVRALIDVNRLSSSNDIYSKIEFQSAQIRNWYIESGCYYRQRFLLEIYVTEDYIDIDIDMKEYTAYTCPDYRIRDLDDYVLGYITENYDFIEVLIEQQHIEQSGTLEYLHLFIHIDAFKDSEKTELYENEFDTYHLSGSYGVLEEEISCWLWDYSDYYLRYPTIIAFAGQKTDNTYEIEQYVQRDNSILQDFLDFDPTLIYSESDFWEYNSYKTIEDYKDNITYYNWSIEFTFVTWEKIQRKYYYNTQVIPNPNLIVSDWGIFNFLRDFFNFIVQFGVNILNGILLFFQFAFYLLTLGFNLLIMFILCVLLIPFLINIVWYWFLTFLIILIWWLWVFIQWFWTKVVIPALIKIWEFLGYLWDWIYDNIIVPLWEWICELWQSWFPEGFWVWFVDVCLLYVAEIIITIISYLITTFLWIITLGSTEYYVLYDNVHNLLETISNVFLDIINIFTTNYVEIFEFIGLYLLNLSLLEVKYIYVKARGMSNRTNQLQQLLDVYMLPIRITKEIIMSIKETVKPV